MDRSLGFYRDLLGFEVAWRGELPASIIGQIVVTPFSAGVDTLLYTDRRIRAEAFDLVLRSGAANAIPGAGTDQLWLTGP